MNAHHASLVLLLAVLPLTSCKSEAAGAGVGVTGNATAASVAGSVPPDGKYENVLVEGRTVPMVNVMNGGSVVLVDTDGKKPRTWEEQFKRKGNVPVGTYDLHKTDANGNNSFEDDPVDRQGTWTIDAKANVTKR